MANVTIYNAAYEGLNLQVAGANTSTQYIRLFSSVVQSYKYSINGGSYNTITGLSSMVDIPFTSGFAEEFLNIEIIPINGGLLSNIYQFYTNGNVIVITTLIELNKMINLTSLIFYSTKSVITGNISDLSSSISTLIIPNTLDGPISDLNNSLQQLQLLNSVSNNKYKTASFSDLPTGLKVLNCGVELGVINFTGTSADWPSGLETIQGIYGNAFTINTNTIPSGMINISFSNTGTPNLTLIGDIADIPSSVRIFRIDNLLSGTLSGNIANLPSGMINFVIFALDSNTITGDVANLPSGMTFFNLNGNNTISGNVSDLPSNLAIITLRGNNTLTGLIQNYSAPINVVIIEGNNTISGDLGLIPVKINYLFIGGNNTISDFTYPSLNGFNNSLSMSLRITGSNTLSSAEVDNILIELAATLTVSTTLTIILQGGAGARTSTSDSAYAYLISKGYNINLN